MDITDYEFSIVEQDAAKTLLNSISPIEEVNKSDDILSYIGEDFSADMEVQWLPGIKFKSCDFFCINWNGINGINSCLDSSTLRSCNFANCNFKWC